MQNDVAPIVLTLDTGIVHEDYQQTAVCLARLGAVRRTCNIYDDAALARTVGAVAAGEIDLIETRHIRKWQQNWSKVKPRFEAVETAARVAQVPMVPTPAMFRWNSNKALYLEAMQCAGVPIVPTIFLRFGAPFRLADVFDQYSRGIVIKPAIAARAHGLHFVKRHARAAGEYLYEIATPKEAEGDRAARTEKTVVDEAGLARFFDQYRRRFAEHSVLVQELIADKVEYSAVMISGLKTYYVKRTEGEDTGIGHDAFGGRNIPEPAPDPAVVEMAARVRMAMPAMLRDEPIVRVDVLATRYGEPLLLEIESGGPRLFNEREVSNTVDRYAHTLFTIARFSRLKFQEQGSRAGVVNANLAPRVEVLEALFESPTAPAERDERLSATSGESNTMEEPVPQRYAEMRVSRNGD